MKNISKEKLEIDSHIYSLIVPKEILENFEIDKVEETEEILVIYLTEKLDKKPKTDKDLVLNGYMNPLEIQGFPVQGKPCYYSINRRRWKEKETKKDIYNSYNFVVEGTKTTHKFGSFLKEIGM